MLKQVTSSGMWELTAWQTGRIQAGLLDRRANSPLDILQTYMAAGTLFIGAGQVHGSSLAMVSGSVGSKRVIPPPVAVALHVWRTQSAEEIPGCDALLTDVPGIALFIRTADCLPVFLADPLRKIVGLIHAGWRGLNAQLPGRVVAAFRHCYQSPTSALRVIIGPAIRSCCYEVGVGFPKIFEPFIHQQNGRRMCDLIGAVKDQLQRSGVRPEHLFDTGQCTSCETQQWYSVRREGLSTGRILSFIMVKP